MSRKILGIAVLVLIPLVFDCSSGPARASDEFQALKRLQIERLFKEVQEADYPNDNFGNTPWVFTFGANGSWDGETTTGSSYSAYGTWRAEGDQMCITLRGGDTRFRTPFEGCFTVLVNWSKGIVAGQFPRQSKRFVMLEDASAELAGLERPASVQKELAQKVEPAPQTASAPAPGTTRSAETSVAVPPPKPAPLPLRQHSQTETLKHQLELQRLALERQRLESETKLQQMKLELEMARLRQQGGTSPSAPAALIPDIAYGRYYALVIGINDYKNLPKLNTAVRDAQTVAKTLQDLYAFNVTLLTDPSRADIVDALDEYRELLAEEDNLLIYYAGHGWLDQQTQAGYWLPVNAKPDRRSRWVSNATLTTSLQGLLAKHVMVVADSCYSGTLTRSIKVPERNRAYLKRISEKRARVVLSSGGLEPVADSGGGQHSVFAAQFLKALRNNKGVLDGTQLFETVRQTVVLNADQTPEYSDIRRAGHEGGDFLFVRKY